MLNKKKLKTMKKLILMISLLIANSIVLMSQQPHTIEFTVNEIVQYYHNEINFCDFDSVTGIIVQKNPNYEGTPFWIDQNDNVIHANFIIITTVNDGKLLYIEKENDLLISVNINIIENEMPEPTFDTIWLHEGMQYNVEPIMLRPTEEDLGYIYAWESDNWPPDSIYQGYELEVGNAGFYHCNMFDLCLHYSKAEFFVEKAPVIGYVSTNLNLNLNELHWTPKGSTYDTIAIYRNGYIVTICDKHDKVWIDPVFNNESNTPWYTMYAIKNGCVIEESASRWMTGISLNITNVDNETVDLAFYGPDNEEEIPLENYIQFFQLYSVESTGWGLVRSMIPIGTTELLDIENDYDTLVIAAVLWNGIEIFSNMVFPQGEIMSNNEKHQQDFQIYPNPTKGILNFSEFIDSEYTIFDLQGRTVMSGRLQQQLDVSSLKKGIYTIEINKGERPFSEKFIRE